MSRPAQRPDHHTDGSHPVALAAGAAPGQRAPHDRSVADVCLTGGQKFYAIAKGHEVGIFKGKYQEVCEGKVKGFSGALFKGFKSEADARAFLATHGVIAEEQENEAPRVPQLSQSSEVSTEAQGQMALQPKREHEITEAAQRAAELGAQRRRDDPPHRRRLHRSPWCT